MRFRRGALTVVLFASTASAVGAQPQTRLAVTTFAGAAGQEGQVDGQGTAARFWEPAGITVDAAGNVYVSEASDGSIRKITTGGLVTTIASGLAMFHLGARSISVDAAGTIHVPKISILPGPGQDSLLKITPAGVVTTVASNLTVGSVATGPSGEVYFTSANAILKLADGEISTLAGTLNVPGNFDGTGPAARFRSPSHLFFDSSSQALYTLDTTDTGVRSIRMVTLDGVVTTLVPVTGLSEIWALAKRPGGDFLLAGPASVHGVSPTGEVTLLAGGGPSGQDGTGSQVGFELTAGIAVDAAGNVYITDMRDATIRRGRFVSLSESAVAAPAAGSSTGLQLSAPGLEWTASSDASWLTVEPASGTGSWPLTLTAASNPGLARSGTATIAGMKVTVTQASDCTFALQPMQVVMGVAAGNDTLTLTTGATCPWTITSNSAWLRASVAGGQGSTQVAFEVDRNLAFSGRSGTLTVAGLSLVVNQEGEGGSALPPGAPQGFAATVTGNDVAFNWTPPASGGFPVGYLLEVGSSPGLTNLGSYPTGSATTAFSVLGVPPGRYLVRVRAGNVRGIGPASNEIEVVVGVLAPPGSPSNLQGTIAGAQLNLSWSAPTGGGPVRQYVIEAGSGPGLANLAYAPTGSSATAFSYDGVPPGRYFFRVRALNDAGVSGASNEIERLAGTGEALPPSPTGLQATMSGTTVTLTWTAGAGGGPAVAYVIEAGTASGLANLGTYQTGTALTSWSYAGVPPGTYYVRVRALNAFGLSAASNEVVVVSGS